MKKIFFILLLVFSFLSSFPAESDLTDEEKKLSEEYIHKGRQERILKEGKDKCLSDSSCKDAIEGKSALDNGSFLGLPRELVEGVVRAYATFMTFGGLVSNNKVETNTGKKEKKNDYCKYIAMAGETIATVMQENEIKEIKATPSTSPIDVELNAFEKQKRLHLSRKEGIRYQTNAWTATAVCYVGEMALNLGVVFDKKFYAKMAAATLIAYYYTWEQKQHQYSIDLVTDTIYSIRKRLKKENGNCNPITERDCYCSEDSTKDDLKYCSGQLRASLTENTQAPCIDINGNQDDKCLCLEKNNCFDKSIIGHFEKHNLTELQKNALAPFLQNARGRSIPGHHAESINKTSKKLFAFNRKFLKDNLSSVKIPESKKGQEYQKNSNASLLAQTLGLNQRAGKLFALAGIDNSIRKEIDLSKNKNKKSIKSETIKARARTVNTKYTNNRPKKKKRNRRKILRKSIVKIKEKHSTEVLKFYSEAVKKAEIIKDKEVSIFLVIKTRYLKLKKRGAL